MYLGSGISNGEINIFIKRHQTRAIHVTNAFILGEIFRRKYLESGKSWTKRNSHVGYYDTVIVNF